MFNKIYTIKKIIQNYVKKNNNILGSLITLMHHHSYFPYLSIHMAPGYQ